MKSSVYNCVILPLNKIHNRAGNITVIENNIHVPFDVKRVYYLYDVPGGAERGGHAHHELQQLIVAASGCFDVLLDDGQNKKIVQLNHSNLGLLVIPGIWREITNFSSGSICLVLASELYNEKDYIRIYKDYINFKTLNENKE